MAFELIAFYLFAGIASLAALGVIAVKNPVHAVMCLVLTFFSTACLWLLLQAEFLGIVLVLVYVGAVMVLFLFVVMMLDINTTPLREGFVKNLPAGVIASVVMLIEILVLTGVWGGRRNIGMGAADPAEAMGQSNLEWIAQSLFTEYLLPFELAAVLLTVGILIAVMLTLRRRTGVKTQDPSKQAAVRREDRLRVIKMPAVGSEGDKQS